jgi:hypothetical protein
MIRRYVGLAATINERGLVADPTQALPRIPNQAITIGDRQTITFKPDIQNDCTRTLKRPITADIIALRKHRQYSPAAHNNATN